MGPQGTLACSSAASQSAFERVHSTASSCGTKAARLSTRPLLVAKHGPVLSKASDRTTHQRRVKGLQRRKVEPIACHVADFEVFNEHMAMRHQLADQRLAVGVRQVASHRAFVAVGTQVIGGFGTVAAVGWRQKRWAPATGVIPAARTFDFDDISPQVRQCLGAPRAIQLTGEVKHAYA